jgi:hypothetical protein
VLDKTASATRSCNSARSFNQFFTVLRKTGYVRATGRPLRSELTCVLVSDTHDAEAFNFGMGY